MAGQRMPADRSERPVSDGQLPEHDSRSAMGCPAVGQWRCLNWRPRPNLLRSVLRRGRSHTFAMTFEACGQVEGTRGGWASPAVALVACIVLGCASVQPAVSDAPQVDPIEFEIIYLPSAPSNPQPGTGTIFVHPPPGRMLIGSAPGARVELRLPYEAPQVLNSMNFQPKAPGDHRYVFKVPATFTTGRFACGPAQPLTEVRVTDVGGATLIRTFALCPGVPLNAELAVPATDVPPLTRPLPAPQQN